ncbi:CRISPR-associated endonuclease Cas3'' [Thermogutta sp.]|uniref:CRISPR-associated endonuclease Cas3'' n=1 Tax=Thermogutta sp. TaxID=1962930 RepID=UPI003C7B023F
MQISHFRAHSANANGQGVSEPLRDHLEYVAQRAEAFGNFFDAAEQARLAGLLHDIGKYADKFQDYLDGKVSRAGDHWSAGSLLALKFANEYGICPALAIQAHHSELTWLPLSYEKFWNNLVERLRNSSEVTDSRADELFQRLQADGLSLPSVTSGFAFEGEHLVAEMLDVRMLFSALVDADYLETEAHFEGDANVPRRPRPDGPSLDCDKAIAALENYLQQVREKHKDSPLSNLRDQLQKNCRERAGDPQGIYTLSAPTGLGKTLAMLLFGLYHARKHNLRRVILVMPYINIIDQTAQIYREIFSVENGFPENFVLEHHSLRDEISKDDEKESLRRLLTENWDAPIILTTNVQFFESLFANRPAQCRKLHRIARSVILFDEVQTLPVHLAVASLAALSRLTEPEGPYGCTVVFSTATQPAFGVLHERVQEFAPHGWQPAEIVSDVPRYFQATAHRVQTTWRDETPVSFDALARELAEYEQVMCIVNLKRHAVAIFRELVSCRPESEHESFFHLSTSLCPRHRRDVLDEVNRRLDAGLPLKLIATQCVEAGVDLDFPVVYRAVGPLEAIAQAAGRCNRHGLRPQGKLVVFMPDDQKDPYPPGYGKAAEATRYFLRRLRTMDEAKLSGLLTNPDAIREYFHGFYQLHGFADSEGTQEERELLQAIKAGDFEEVARLYRLIRQQTIHVLVPYDRAAFDSLLNEVNSKAGTPGWIRQWCRQASPLTVDIFPPGRNSSNWNYLHPIEFFPAKRSSSNATDWYYLLPSLEYDPRLGLVFPEDDSSFVV